MRINGGRIRSLRACLVVIVLAVAIPAAITGGSGESIFWTIEKEDAVIYLLGSIHMGSPDFYPFPDDIENAFRQSDCLVLEVDADAMDQAELAAIVTAHGVFRDGQTLSGVVSAKVYDTLQAEFKRYGMDLAQFDPLQPWMTAITLTTFQMMKMGFLPEHGVDAYFRRNSGDREIGELETAAEQLSLFSSLDMGLQVMLLEDALYELDKSEGQIRELFTAYKKGDAGAIKEFLFETIESNPHLKPLYRKLLDDRNARMVEKLEGYLRSGRTCFVVVGAAHLFGGNGIVQLMRNKGYTLKPAAAAN
ncbi:MAG TPA: TraB/GumN family protein [Acidobacteriota bacterium]|nr:TraB/GumN family protein [Acidobacteriota bacterium]